MKIFEKEKNIDRKRVEVGREKNGSWCRSVNCSMLCLAGLRRVIFCNCH